MSDFSALGLPEVLVRAVLDRGYTQPTPVQRQAIPLVMDGRDIIAGAQTGTGKTAAFVLPLLARLGAQDTPARRTPRALVLTPTRELAAQVEESVRHYGAHTKLRSLVIFGGVGINPQIDGLRRGVDILVATPGRLLDHLQQRTVDLSQLQVFVLDEADRMLDMGFIRDIRKVLAQLPKQRQNLLFSATFPAEIKELAASLLHDPAEVEIAPQGTTAERIAQRIVLSDRGRKKELLLHLFRAEHWSQALVFTRTKHLANRLAEFLDDNGVAAMAIHGNKSQTARTKALSEFKAGKLQALVATDIAARGIDIKELPVVVNFELPMVAEDYVHRIGRTARASASGKAVSLVCVDEFRLLQQIERLTRQRFDREQLAGFEADLSATPEPIETGRGQRGPRPGQGAPRSGGGGDRHAPRRPAGSGEANRGGEQRRAGPADGNRSHDPRRQGGVADGNRSHDPRRQGNGTDGNRVHETRRPGTVDGNRAHDPRRSDGNRQGGQQRSRSGNR